MEERLTQYALSLTPGLAILVPRAISQYIGYRRGGIEVLVVGSPAGADKQIRVSSRRLAAWWV